MGAIFTVSVVHGEIADTPQPRLALVAHGGVDTEPALGAATIALGAEREGLPAEVVEACDATWNIPVREDAVESLGVAATAAIALEPDRVARRRFTMSTLDRIEELKAAGEGAIASAPDAVALEALRVRYLGRKSELTGILRGIGDLPAEEKGPVGAGANRARKALETALEAREAALESGELETKLAADAIDVTLPGTPARADGSSPPDHAHAPRDRGHLHRPGLPRHGRP